MQTRLTTTLPCGGWGCFLQSFQAAAALGAVCLMDAKDTECSTLPIDLTKTWLQIQGQKNDANYNEIGYCGMLHVLVRTGREEGLKALNSGSMLRFCCRDSKEKSSSLIHPYQPDGKQAKFRSESRFEKSIICLMFHIFHSAALQIFLVSLNQTDVDTLQRFDVNNRLGNFKNKGISTRLKDLAKVNFNKRRLEQDEHSQEGSLTCSLSVPRGGGSLLSDPLMKLGLEDSSPEYIKPVFLKASQIHTAGPLEQLDTHRRSDRDSKKMSPGEEKRIPAPIVYVILLSLLLSSGLNFMRPLLQLIMPDLEYTPRIYYQETSKSISIAPHLPKLRYGTVVNKKKLMPIRQCPLALQVVCRTVTLNNSTRCALMLPQPNAFKCQKNHKNGRAKGERLACQRHRKNYLVGRCTLVLFKEDFLTITWKEKGTQIGNHTDK
ncbi:hypothetical protein E5288_WYG012703 [Bos mutus]|uniref:Uncharacterized protein n=1 Tax=Bos mutus TaxID=72004 RepID=A0A6B0QZM5_9CETA|nr:hypothetical protein [Bos mutus]